MGKKSKRDRQARIARKRKKRASSRPSRKSGTPGESVAFDSPVELATAACVFCVGALLADGGRLAGELRQAAVMARVVLGGLLARIPFELEAFLYDGKAWSITCAELKSVRHDFASRSAMNLYDRLWSLSLTNEPDPEAFAGYVPADCPHRAALAFEQLRACLDDPKLSPRKALRAITAEIDKHSAPHKGLAGMYEGVLQTALAAVHASTAEQGTLLERFAVQYRKVCEQGERDSEGTAWWACGRLFLMEVCSRLEESEAIRTSPAHAQLLMALLPAPQAAVRLAQVTGSAERLRAVHFPGAATLWRSYLEKQIDAPALPFEDRIRYEIARLKLLRAQARRAPDDDDDEDEEEIGAFLKAFESLQRLLAHGVPPQSAAIPGYLALPLIDFYVEALQELHCEKLALRTTEQLLQRHPEDFRLACLYATGAVRQGDYKKLSILARRVPRSHVDLELFARCALIWAQDPRGTKAATILRQSLFDPMDREHRKQCLIALSRHCLRRAATVADYGERLRSLLPYFDRDSFIYRDLREKVAVESSLVFLATMMAPLHNVELPLTEEQSQQWLSHAREIARYSPLGAQIVARYLSTPSRWFQLAPEVLQSARAQLGRIEPPAPPPPGSRKPEGSKKRRSRKQTEGPSPQADLF